jgi:TetR/AcrR family transcriptional regulator, cholesterol catabolism regulator
VGASALSLSTRGRSTRPFTDGRRRTLSVSEGAPTRQRLKWLRRQQEIIEGAARVFYVKGYDGTSMDDIADAVGLLKGSLYHYISSKEELLYWIAKSVDAVTMATMEDTARRGGTAVERLREHIVTHLDLGGPNSDAVITKIQVYYREFRCLSPEHQHEVAAGRRRYEAYTRALLDEARSEGAVCPDRDLDVLAPAILSMMNSVILAHRPARHIDWQHIADEYAAFILQGLSCPASHDHRRAKRVANGRRAKPT